MINKKGLFLVFSTAIISGLAIFISKFGVSVINPYIFTGLKNMVVALLAVSWLLAMKDWPLLKRLKPIQWLKLVSIGLIGGSVPFLLFFKGLSLTNPAQASFIHKTMFVFVALLAFAFLKEKISRRLLTAGLFLIIGNLLLLKLIPARLNWGDFMILAATLLWAFESVLSKHTLKDLPARVVIWGRMFFGSLFILVFWLISHQALLALSLNLEQLGWVLITAVFLFGYVVTWYSGLKYVPVSIAAMVLALGSPITTLLSLIFLGQAINIWQSLGIVFVVLGVMAAIGGAIIYQALKKLKDLVYVRS